MSSETEFTVAIVGAGLAGLSLALSLQSQDIKCIVYEAYASPEQAIKGSLSLAPNGLAALETLDVLPALERRGCSIQHAKLHDRTDEVMSEILIGHKEHFGYNSLRILRASVVEELVDALVKRGIELECNKKFSRIVSESVNDGVIIEFADGTTSASSLVVGADGIHSRTRQVLFPDVHTQYIGTSGVVGSVSQSQASLLKFEHTGMYISPGVGTMLLWPHTSDQQDFSIGIQSRYPDLGRKGFQDMAADNKRLRTFLETGKIGWPKHIQQAITNVREETLFLWPMQQLPELNDWTSPHKRVILIGDAAHAMPPTAGQGVNQAFEDARTLSLILATVQRGVKDLGSGLDFWQDMRRERIRSVVDLALLWNKARQLNRNENEKKNIVMGTANVESERITQMKWLYDGLKTQEEKIQTWSAGA